jgi:hypothetical protein
MQVGTRVRVINPKTVAHYAVIGVEAVGSITAIDPEYFARRNRANTRYGFPIDFPVSMRTTDDDRGFYVQFEGADLPPTAYRASELRVESKEVD